MRNRLALALLLLVCSAPLFADFGTQDFTYTVIQAADFRPLDSATGYITNIGDGRLSRTSGGGPFFYHAIDIPHGAMLADVTVYVTDNDATYNVVSWLYDGSRASGIGTGVAFQPATNSATSGVPGDTTIVLTWNAPLPAFSDPNDVSWGVLVSLPTTGTTVSFNGVRLKWKRQVSAAPVTARFNDVPTSHPFFRYVEALAAAGVTGGCSTNPPNYCPDAPVTRGQMAVFLATALGLHFAP